METKYTPQEQLAQTNSNSMPNLKTKILVIMGATGSGKSKLAIDLASHFPIEIINADSMQVYKGLDVLTNKVPLHERKGIPHHLLGTISPNVEYTAKDFRDSAIPLINEIWSRNRLPVIVGGTNYYIQALVSRFLLDDHAEYLEEDCSPDIPVDNEEADFQLGPSNENCDYTYSRLKDLDPVAANRIHPNDQRKDWGRADNLRYDCCFICLDASLPELDKYVNRRVDQMVSTGLLEEVRDIYNFDADYTRGLRQAIGVREFDDFLRYWNSECLQQSSECLGVSKHNMLQVLDSSSEDQLKITLVEAIERVKLNTRRLIRFSDNLWAADVLEPSANIIKSFLDKDVKFNITKPNSREVKVKRDLWTRYVCQACGNKELRGAHEWEQHNKGRCHRKRISKLRKSGKFSDLSQNNFSD
ncbi:tRNA dimethylallyltransferase 2 [Striga asiatica]|uniref:tRNA dimethylallyltransferase 2 n=1 Tax=Striga asiatica TaxID=4170 RepID=A0A5A7Q3K2_STRAF|nr:tRNA dimethylallyltransferase 2 [Striga asiatica]